MDAKPQELEPQFPPANIWMRMVAFGLDMLLVLAALHMIHLMLPATAHEFIKDMQGEQVTFKEVFDDSQQFVREHPEAASKLMFASMFSMIAPFLYFALSEIFLGGCTLGKKCFNLRTAYRDSPRLPPLGAQAIRSFVKSIASLALISQNPLFFIFFMNFLIAFYNKGRKAGHDLISRTSVVPGFLPDDDSKENQHQ